MSKARRACLSFSASPKNLPYKKRNREKVYGDDDENQSGHEQEFKNGLEHSRNSRIRWIAVEKIQHQRDEHRNDAND